jgi:F0F1-type ATP synthase membrane subunit a
MMIQSELHKGCPNILILIKKYSYVEENPQIGAPLHLTIFLFIYVSNDFFLKYKINVQVNERTSGTFQSLNSIFTASVHVSFVLLPQKM